MAMVVFDYSGHASSFCECRHCSGCCRSPMSAYRYPIANRTTVVHDRLLTRHTGSTQFKIECLEADIASRLRRLICETIMPVQP